MAEDDCLRLLSVQFCVLIKKDKCPRLSSYQGYWVMDEDGCPRLWSDQGYLGIPKGNFVPPQILKL